MIFITRRERDLVLAVLHVPAADQHHVVHQALGVELGRLLDEAEVVQAPGAAPRGRRGSRRRSPRCSSSICSRSSFLVIPKSRKATRPSAISM